MFCTCLLKKRLFQEKVAPSFLHTITAFWLDFEGLGPSGGFKKQEKTAPGKSCFFGLKRNVPKSVFYDFRVIFGAILEVKNQCKIIKLDFTLCFVIWRVPGSVLLRFGVILGLLLRWFGRFFGDVSESWFVVGFLVVSIWNVVEAALQARPKTT